MKLKETETDILRAVRDYLRLKGFFVIRHQQGLGSHKGLSDLTVIKGGRTVWIEIKKEKGVLSEHQWKFSAEVRNRGGEYLVIRSLHEAIEVFGKLDGRRNHG